MNRRNFAVTALALTAMAMAPLSACGNKDKGGAGTSSNAEVLSYLPADSGGVLGISWNKASSSALFKKHQDKVLGNEIAKLAEFKTKCNIDLVTDIHGITVGLSPDLQDESKVVVAINGKFDQKKIEGCITTMGGIVKDGVYTSEGKNLNVYWPSSNTVLVSKGMSVDALKKSASGGGVKSNKALMEIIGKVDSKATVWAAAKIPASFAKLMPMGSPPDSVYLSLALSANAKVSVGMLFKSPEEAKGFESLMSLGMSAMKSQPVIGDVLTKLETKIDDNLMTLSVDLSEADIEGIITKM